MLWKDKRKLDYLQVNYFSISLETNGPSGYTFLWVVLPSCSYLTTLNGKIQFIGLRSMVVHCFAMISSPFPNLGDGCLTERPLDLSYSFLQQETSQLLTALGLM